LRRTFNAGVGGDVEMSLTVKQLIKELKKYPANSRVGMKAHDNKENEIDGIVSSVDEFDPETSFDPDYCQDVYVVLLD